MLVAGGGKKGSGLWIAMVLLLLRISVKGSNESREYRISQYLIVISPIEIVEKTLAYVYSR